MQHEFALQAETRVILNERILLDEAQARAAQAETRQGEGDINTDDDDDDTAEYEQWHHREMARIARSDADTLQCLLSTWHLRVTLCAVLSCINSSFCLPVDGHLEPAIYVYGVCQVCEANRPKLCILGLPALACSNAAGSATD